MKLNPFAVTILVGALMVAVFPARRGAADDAKDIQIKIEAPLEAADCTTTPATITVLGLSIDISKAKVETSTASTPAASPTPATGADDGSRRRGGSGTTTAGANCYYNVCLSPPAAPTPTGCTALTVGQDVEVKFASDELPLTATEVQQDASALHNLKLQGPLQSVDANLQTITLLGLSIDVSGAGLEGADDDSSHSQPIDLSSLMEGQSVEVTLASSTPPFAAAEVEVKNFTNRLQVNLTDPDGNSVTDSTDDVTIDVVQTVPSSTPGATDAPTPTVLRFHKGSSGSFTLSGLAARRARLFVTRVHDGEATISRHSVRVRPNTRRSIHVRLRPLVSGS
jgi:cold shock CspA family protein